MIDTKRYNFIPLLIQQCDHPTYPDVCHLWASEQKRVSPTLIMKMGISDIYLYMFVKSSKVK